MHKPLPSILLTVNQLQLSAHKVKLATNVQPVEKAVMGPITRLYLLPICQLFSCMATKLPSCELPSCLCAQEYSCLAVWLHRNLAAKLAKVVEQILTSFYLFFDA